MNNPLIELYPFLQLRNDFTDEIIDTDDTWLNQMPEGWCSAFGVQMAKEISDILKKANFENDYRILQIKEKWGGLRWYDGGAPNEIYDELQECIAKYEYISQKTCVGCGISADGHSRGWILPLCQECANKQEINIFPFEE